MCISLYYGYYLRSLGFGASLRALLPAFQRALLPISEVSASELHLGLEQVARRVINRTISEVSASELH